MSAPADGRRAIPWVLVIVLLAAALRATGLVSWPFEQDELYTLHDAESLGRQSGGPGIMARPLYYLLQHALLAVAPPTPLMLRLPALLFGVLGVWITYVLGNRVFGRTAGAAAAFLLAISPWHLYASQFARYWTLVYVWSALLCLTLPRAVDEDRPARLLACLLVLAGGWLTHPTFVFAAAGIIVAVLAVRRDGTLAWPWPTMRAWLFLWAPFVLLVMLHGVLVAIFGNPQSFGSIGGRGPLHTLRTVPAMVQWLSPEIAAAAAVGALVFLLHRASALDRRWGAMAIAGTMSSIGLLLLAGRRSPVYADYGMALLPLVFVTLGGAVQRIGEALARGQRLWAFSATAVLTAGALPGTVSHLMDGTRYDYRPTYRYLAQHAAGHLVLGWPMVLQRHYAPGLRFAELRFWSGQFELALGQERGFWVVTSQARQGMVGDDGRLTTWLDAHCRVVLRNGRPRVDYRSYWVELFWCGDMSPPGPVVTGVPKDSG